jgi:hypothetical protein
MRYLQQYEAIEQQILHGSQPGTLTKDENGKVACLGKFFAKLANVLPLQEEDYACLREAGQREDILLLAAASMRPAKRNSAGFAVLFDAVCGYAKIDVALAEALQGRLRDQTVESQGGTTPENAVDLDM